MYLYKNLQSTPLYIALPCTSLPILSFHCVITAILVTTSMPNLLAKKQIECCYGYLLFTPSQLFKQPNNNWHNQKYLLWDNHTLRWTVSPVSACTSQRTHLITMVTVHDCLTTYLIGTALTVTVTHQWPRKKWRNKEWMKQGHIYIYIYMTSLLISVNQTDCFLTQTSLSRLKITSNLVTQVLTQCVYYSHMMPLSKWMKKWQSKNADAERTFVFWKSNI